MKNCGVFVSLAILIDMYKLLLFPQKVQFIRFFFSAEKKRHLFACISRAQINVGRLKVFEETDRLEAKTLNRLGVCVANIVTITPANRTDTETGDHISRSNREINDKDN